MSVSESSASSGKEKSAADQVFNAPNHPYTALLLAATPGSGLSPDDLGMGMEGTGELGVHDQTRTWDEGCAYRRRCPRADTICASTTPGLEDGEGGISVACHFPGYS